MALSDFRRIYEVEIPQMIGWYMFLHTGLCWKGKVGRQCTVHRMENFRTLLSLTELTDPKTREKLWASSVHHNCLVHFWPFLFYCVFCLSLIVLLNVFLLKRKYLIPKLECFISGETLSW